MSEKPTAASYEHSSTAIRIKSIPPTSISLPHKRTISEKSDTSIETEFPSVRTLIAQACTNPSSDDISTLCRTTASTETAINDPTVEAVNTPPAYRTSKRITKKTKRIQDEE
jgi:hypothetical protein